MQWSLDIKTTRSTRKIRLEIEGGLKKQGWLYQKYNRCVRDGLKYGGNSSMEGS